jgi:hypothetical protein
LLKIKKARKKAKVIKVDKQSYYEMPSLDRNMAHPIDTARDTFFIVRAISRSAMYEKELFYNQNISTLFNLIGKYHAKTQNSDNKYSNR